MHFTDLTDSQEVVAQRQSRARLNVLAMRTFRLLFILSFALLSSMAQEFKITEARLDNGRVVLTYPSDPAFYYILTAGSSLATITTSTRMTLGTAGTGQLINTLAPDSKSVFYRIQRVSISQPLDSDNDKIDDVWELQRSPPLNPLDGLDSQLPSAGPGSPTWEQIYNTEQVSLQVPIAYFPTIASTIFADATNAAIRVAFTKPITGQLTYQLSGTAIPTSTRVEGDFVSPLGFVNVVGATNAVISLILTPRAAIENDRTILLALSVARGTNSAYRTAIASVHELKIIQGDRGVFAGTLSIADGLMVGSLPVKMALRTQPNGLVRAFFDLSGDPLLGKSFNVAASATASSFQLNDSSYSHEVSSTPFGRSLNLKIQFGPTQAEQDSFTIPVTLAAEGLSSSGKVFTGAGILRLTQIR